MNIETLKQTVCKANRDLVKHGLVIFPWGNVSAIDREKAMVVIKPSGLAFDELKAEDMVVLNLEGEVLEGNYKPTSDYPTHLELYRNFKNISSIVHTHSEWATTWAQAGRSIPAFGASHADYFYGEIPCTRFQYEAEVENNYERETGRLIVDEFFNKNPDQIPGVLVAGHGPFTWGKNTDDAVHNAQVLEYLSKMAYQTQILGRKKPIERFMLRKHYLQKNGN